MKKLIKILSIITFLSATATVAGIFYEGLILKWLPFVGILIHATDILFLITAISGTFYYKSNKNLFYSHLFSLTVIIAGIIMTLIFGQNIPKILFLLWEFYILYFYGIVVCKKLWEKL
jgi:intracellular septation protein A